MTGIQLVEVLLESHHIIGPAWFLGVLGVFLAGVAISLLLERLLASDLAGLALTEQRMPVTAFYAETARKHSLPALVMNFLGCVAFVAIGLWIAATISTDFGLICATFFGLFGVISGYTLWLKRGQPAA